MLLNNFTRFGRVQFVSGGGVSTFGTASLMRRMAVYENARFGEGASIPQGYTQAHRATVPALSAFNGKIAARLGGDSAATASVVGVGVLGATLQGDSAISSAAAYLALVGSALLQGDSTFLGTIVGAGKLSARLDVGAQPSAFDIAQEVLGSVIESGVDLRSVLRILAAVAAGKTDINTSGPDPVVTFRDVNDTKDRVTATMSGSERATVVIDAS